MSLSTEYSIIYREMRSVLACGLVELTTHLLHFRVPRAKWASRYRDLTKVAERARNLTLLSVHNLTILVALICVINAHNSSHHRLPKCRVARSNQEQHDRVSWSPEFAPVTTTSFSCILAAAIAQPHQSKQKNARIFYQTPCGYPSWLVRPWCCLVTICNTVASLMYSTVHHQHPIVM